MNWMAARAPIDAFGALAVTDLATSADAPALGIVYKMVEIERGGRTALPPQNSAKINARSQAQNRFFRFFLDHDVVGDSCASECFSCERQDVEALQRPVILQWRTSGGTAAHGGRWLGIVRQPGSGASRRRARVCSRRKIRGASS